MPHVPRNRCCYPDASEINYLPSEAVDWIGNPGTVQIALDELADRVHEIEINGGGGPIGDVDASIVTYTPSVDAASCWQGSSDPGNVNDALDQIVLRICDLEASLGSGVPTDASMITYTPSVSSLACWQGSSDPGNVNDALDQIVLRVCDVEQCCDSNTDLLDNLLPPNAPDLDYISYASASGVSGKLSFDVSNTISGYNNVPDVLVDQSFTVSGDRKGIYASGGSITGIINDDVVADSNGAYPADSFGYADEGVLQLLVNGSVVHSVDLSVFTSGNSYNGNGSGFSSLSAATPVNFPNSQPFSLRKYRTGGWIVTAADLSNGYNTIQVKHDRVSVSDSLTQTYNLVIDASTTATSYASASFSGLSATGSKYLSGVRYHTGATATYNITIQNAYRNTYSSSGSAVSHPTSRNCSISSSSIPNCSGNEAADIVLAKTVTMDQTRIIKGLVGESSTYGFGVSTSTLRTVQSTITSSITSDYTLLIDNQSATSTDLINYFDDENYRFHSGSNFATNLSANWDSTESLVGVNLNYVNALQTVNGAVYYPSIDFTTTNMPNAYAGSPNYSTATGTRYYYGYFTNATVAANFRLRITGTATLISEATSFTSSSAQVKISLRLPSQTGWMDIKTSYIPGSWSDGDGCYSATYGSDTSIPTGANGIGITFGTKNTASSFDKVYYRISAPQGWTGNLTSLQIEWGV